MRSTKRSVLLASLLGGTHGGGVSVPRREPPAVPWQNCPWLLQDKVNLRAEDPPRWCFDLQNLGQAFCERGYIGPDKPGVNLYRKCIYAAGKCVMAKDGVECQPNDPAVTPARNPVLPTRPVDTSWDEPSPPPRPRPPPPPREVVAVRASRPSPSPPPDATDPFAPSMRLQAPRLMSADCRSVTLGWAPPQAALASGIPPRYAVYYSDAGSEKPWNLGLRGTSATVTGLAVGTPYTFYVAMSQSRGWGPRSQGLAVSTTATCASPTDQTECTGIAMGAPLVSPLNCVAMLLEVPSGKGVDRGWDCRLLMRRAARPAHEASA